MKNKQFWEVSWNDYFKILSLWRTLEGYKSEPMERSQEDLLQTWQEMMAAQTGEGESLKG